MTRDEISEMRRADTEISDVGNALLSCMLFKKQIPKEISMKSALLAMMVLGSSFAQAKITKVSAWEKPSYFMATQITANGEFVFLAYDNQIHRKDLKTGDLKLITNTAYDNYDGSMNASADGTQIVYGSKPAAPYGCLKFDVKNIESGEVRTFEAKAAVPPKLSPDGKVLVGIRCGTHENTIIELHFLDTKEESSFTQEQVPQQIRFSPDSQNLVISNFTDADFGGDIGVYNFQKRELQVHHLEDGTNFERMNDCVMSRNNKKIFCSTRSYRDSYEDEEMTGISDILEYDLETQKWNFHNRDGEGAFFEGNSRDPQISDDGKFLFFFVKDIPLGNRDYVNILIRKNLETGEISNLAKAYHPESIDQLSISSDGSKINFWSDSRDLIYGAPKSEGSYLWTAE